MVTPVSGTTQAQEEGGYWELIGIYTNDWETELAAWNDAEECINLEITVSEGSFTATNTYICEANPMGFSFQKPGMTESLTGTWSNPSETIIYPGEPFTIDLSSTVTRMDDPEREYIFHITAFYGTIDDLNGIFGRYLHHNYMKDENGIHVAVTSELTETSITTVSGTMDAGSFEGEQMVITVSVYGYIKILTKYVYEWRSQSIGSVIGQEPEIESESSNKTSNPASEGVLGRAIVVVGIAIAGILSTIAGELANKTAQAAAAGKEEQPAEETVYVLNPSHKQFDLEVNKPVTLTVNAYRVTKEGHQIEKGANISLNLPPDLAKYFNIQTTTSTGQLTANITLLKTPSSSSVILDVNGVFPHGKAKAQVKLEFKTEFTISPVHSPKITYYEKDKQWKAPDLVACFRDPVQKTPIKVGFYYGFMDPPLTFEPDILEVKEGYSSDDGLTYNFKLKVHDGIDLETYFGEDLTDDDGRVKVNVVVKDEKGKEFTAKTELQVSPQLKMIACSYNKNVKTRGQRATPYKGLELEEMEFIADGIDKLPLVIFFIRSDKEVTKGSEAEAVMDIVEVQKLEWSTTSSFEEPEVNSENTSDGFFAYDLSSSRFIDADKDKVNGVYSLEVDARIRADGPENYSFDGDSMRFLVKPQFMKFHFWVVPGALKGTSEAYAYVQLNPSKSSVPNVPLTLEIENPPDRERGFLELIYQDREQNTREPAPGNVTYTSTEYIPLPKGSACWGLKYSGMRWDNLTPSVFGASSPSEYRVICTGPESDTGPIWQASQTINVGQNINTLLSDLLSSADSPDLKLNNPYWKGWKDSAIPYFIRGPITNFFSWTVPEYKLYVCKEMRDRIIDWLQKRSLYIKGDDPKKIESMFKMNGIDYEIYEILYWHTWAGIFLSGSDAKKAKALDPWWEQRWDDPSLKDHENLITVYTEYTNLKLSERGLSLRAFATITAGLIPLAALFVGIFAQFGVTLAIPAIITSMNTWLFGAGGVVTAVNALETVGGDETSAIYNQHDRRKKKYDVSWFVYFIQSLSNTND